MLNLQGVPWDNRSRVSSNKLNDFRDNAVCNPSPKAEWKYHELFVSQFKDARSQSGSPKGMVESFQGMQGWLLELAFKTFKGFQVSENFRTSEL